MANLITRRTVSAGWVKNKSANLTVFQYFFTPCGSTFLTSDVKPMLDPGFKNDCPVFISSEELEIAKMTATGKSIKSITESIIPAESTLIYGKP
ncbi:MAG: hypothetical protein EOM90_06915 [Alphaproteobacteria bacterium]|nr:hypothetical protein [Alphaproteobacteria bacterium]